MNDLQTEIRNTLRYKVNIPDINNPKYSSISKKNQIKNLQTILTKYQNYEILTLLNKGYTIDEVQEKASMKHKVEYINKVKLYKEKLVAMQLHFQIIDLQEYLLPHAEIILSRLKGLTQDQIVKNHGKSKPTVNKICKRYEKLQGLINDPNYNERNESTEQPLTEKEIASIKKYLQKYSDIVELIEQDYSQRVIAKQTGKSNGTVVSVRKKLEKLQNHNKAQKAELIISREVHFMEDDTENHDQTSLTIQNLLADWKASSEDIKSWSKRLSIASPKEAQTIFQMYEKISKQFLLDEISRLTIHISEDKVDSFLKKTGNNTNRFYIQNEFKTPNFFTFNGEDYHFTYNFYTEKGNTWLNENFLIEGNTIRKQKVTKSFKALKLHLTKLEQPIQDDFLCQQVIKSYLQHRKSELLESIAKPASIASKVSSQSETSEIPEWVLEPESVEEDLLDSDEIRETQLKLTREKEAEYRGYRLDSHLAKMNSYREKRKRIVERKKFRIEYDKEMNDKLTKMLNCGINPWANEWVSHTPPDDSYDLFRKGRQLFEFWLDDARSMKRFREMFTHREKTIDMDLKPFNIQEAINYVDYYLYYQEAIEEYFERKGHAYPNADERLLWKDLQLQLF